MTAPQYRWGGGPLLAAARRAGRRPEDLRTIGPYSVTREVSRSDIDELLLHADAADGSELAIRHSDAAQNMPFMTTRELFGLNAGRADAHPALAGG